MVVKEVFMLVAMVVTGDPFGGQVDGGDCGTHRDHPHTRPIGRQVSSYQSQLDPSCPLVLATLVLQAPRLTSDQPPIINSYSEISDFQNLSVLANFWHEITLYIVQHFF